MKLRLLQVHARGLDGERVKEVLRERPTVAIWHGPVAEGETEVSVLLSAEESDGVIDLLDQHFGKLDSFRIFLLPVEATVPRPEEVEPVREERRRRGPFLKRVSTEELYSDISEAARLTGTYVFLVVLSALVAAMGILRDDFIVIIGAMVIAPLLGPNVALVLSATLGDASLAKRAFAASAIGLLLTVSIGVIFGLVFPIDPTAQQIAARTLVTPGDVILALAAGGAGAIAFTVALPAVLIGVMVAVALLPPSITLGMLLGSGHWELAAQNLLLLLVFLVGINLAGVVTFLAQGVRPRTWWEEERAKRATSVALLIWILLLVFLVVAIALSQAA